MNFPWTNKKDQKIRKLRKMISDLITQDLFMYDKVSESTKIILLRILSKQLKQIQKEQ